MGYKIYLKNIKTRRYRTPWFTWILWGFHRRYQKSPSCVVQIFEIYNIPYKTKKSLKKYIIYDFGLLVSSVEKYQPNLVKEFLLIEKNP